MTIKKSYLLVIAFMLCLACAVSPFFIQKNNTYATNEEKYYCDDTYNGLGTPVDIESNFTYDNYDLTLEYIQRMMPDYESVNQANACAPTAGTIVVAYYDVDFPNLIPDYEPGSLYNGVYYWGPMSMTILSVKEDLYDRMKTNVYGAGTTINLFKSGLESYVEDSGYNIAYNRAYNLTQARSYFENNIPVVLFLNSYTYYTFAGFSVGSTQANLVGKQSSASHVCVAYGYAEYQFYTNGSLSRTEKYLIVSFGNETSGYLSVNSMSSIDEMWAVTVSN